MPASCLSIMENHQSHLPNCNGNFTRKPRRRCKSWNINAKIPVEESDCNSNQEFFAKGAALIIVSKDGSQIIGNFVNKCKGTVFKVSGVRLPELCPPPAATPDMPENAPRSIGENYHMGSPSRILELKGARSYRSTPSVSSDGSAEAEKCIDDSDLDEFIQEDEEADFDATIGEKIIDTYGLNINDMDTGLNYTFADVKCIRTRQNRSKKSHKDSCRLTHPEGVIQFKSVTRLHGDKANLVINDQLGPRYMGQKFNVFKGEMAFTYRLPVCYPKSTVNETQWCL